MIGPTRTRSSCGNPCSRESGAGHRDCADAEGGVGSAGWDFSKGPARPPRSQRCGATGRSEEHTSELQSQSNLVCRLLLEKKKKTKSHKDLAADELYDY